MTENNTISKLGSLQYRPRDPEITKPPGPSIVHRLVRAWSLAEPAIDRVVEQTDWLPWLQRLLLILDDTPDDVATHNRLVDELIEGVAGVMQWVHPKHDEGWSRPEQRPSVCLPALVNVLMELQLSTTAPTGPAGRPAPRKRAEPVRRRPRHMVAPLPPNQRPAYAGEKGRFYHTDETVRRVLEACASKKMRHVEIGRRFGMSPSYVSFLASGKAKRVQQIIDHAQQEHVKPVKREPPRPQYTPEEQLELEELERQEREEMERNQALS